MNTSPVHCPKCQARLLGGIFNLPELTPCPACGKGLQVEIFPAYFRPVAAGNAGEAIMMEGEAACFYHAQKKAIRPCESCGRFVCALCDCEFDGRHICPTCLEAGKTKGKIKNLTNTRTLYDSMTLSLAVVPMVIFYLTFISSPIVLFMVFRYWNAPSSLVRSSKWRFVVAFLIALAQVIGWVSLIILFTHRVRRHGR